MDALFIKKKVKETPVVEEEETIETETVVESVNKYK